MEPRGTELRRWIGPMSSKRERNWRHLRAYHQAPATDRDNATAGRNSNRSDSTPTHREKIAAEEARRRPKRSGGERDLEAAQRASQIPQSRRPPDPVARSRAPSPGLDRISGGRRFGDGEISPRLGPGRAGPVGAGEPWRRRRRRPPPPRRRARTISRPGRSG